MRSDFNEQTRKHNRKGIGKNDRRNISLIQTKCIGLGRNPVLEHKTYQTRTKTPVEKILLNQTKYIRLGQNASLGQKKVTDSDQTNSNRKNELTRTYQTQINHIIKTKLDSLNVSDSDKHH